MAKPASVAAPSLTKGLLVLALGTGCLGCFALGQVIGHQSAPPHVAHLTERPGAPPHWKSVESALSPAPLGIPATSHAASVQAIVPIAGVSVHTPNSDISLANDMSISDTPQPVTADASAPGAGSAKHQHARGSKRYAAPSSNAPKARQKAHQKARQKAHQKADEKTHHGPASAGHGKRR